jgi:hypothetical protein
MAPKRITFIHWKANLGFSRLAYTSISAPMHSVSGRIRLRIASAARVNTG